MRVRKPEPYAPGKDFDDWDFTFNGYAGKLDPAYPALLKTARQSPTVVMATPPHERQSATLLYLLTMLTQKGARTVVRKAGNNPYRQLCLMYATSDQEGSTGLFVQVMTFIIFLHFSFSHFFNFSFIFFLFSFFHFFFFSFFYFFHFFRFLFFSHFFIFSFFHFSSFFPCFQFFHFYHFFIFFIVLLFFFFIPPFSSFFFSFSFLGCSKSDFFLASIASRFLVTFL